MLFCGVALDTRLLVTFVTVKALTNTQAPLDFNHLQKESVHQIKKILIDIR